MPQHVEGQGHGFSAVSFHDLLIGIHFPGQTGLNQISIAHVFVIHVVLRSTAGGCLSGLDMGKVIHPRKKVNGRRIMWYITDS